MAKLIDSKSSIIPLAQGAFFIASGLWPIVHYKSFEGVTGRKNEDWLVKTMGALITAVGLTLIVESRRKSTTGRVLAIASSLALAGADLLYVSKKKISPVYLLDAATELGFIGSWILDRLVPDDQHKTATVGQDGSPVSPL